MKRFTPDQIEALVNWDGLLCKPPWRTDAERRQYYARYLSRYLWRYFSTEDWQNIENIIDELRLPPKIKAATLFLLPRHL